MDATRQRFDMLPTRNNRFRVVMTGSTAVAKDMNPP
jgi:hypothetical protein